MWLPTFADALPVLRGPARRGRPVSGDGRRRRGCAWASGGGWARLLSDAAADPFACSATSRSHASPRCAPAAPRSCSRASARRPAVGAACVGARRAGAGRCSRVGLQPADRRRGRRRPGAEAGGCAGGDRAGGGAWPGVWWGRASARGGRLCRARGPVGDRVRREHTRHRRRRGTDERQRLRRPARPAT